MDILNPGEKHVPCVLLVDTSSSMRGVSIDELNAGLVAFSDALQNDRTAGVCADVCVISFNSDVEIVQEFCPGLEFVPPVLQANGATAMNEAIITGLDLLEQRKQEYRDLGVDYWRPWLFLLSDGGATDTELSEAAHVRMQEALGEGKPKVTFFPMAVGPNLKNTSDKLKTYTKDGEGLVLKATSENFREAFVWLSSSIVEVSHSNPSQDKMELPPLPANIITIDL